jgi:hypothetical protein
MSPGSGNDRSRGRAHRTHEFPKADFFNFIIPHIQAAAIARACARALLRAACALAALSLAILAGCAESNPYQVCEGRVGLFSAQANDQPWDSEAQRRAAVAIECDAHEIQGRISTAPLTGLDFTALYNRKRELVDLALETVRTSGVKSSRLPLSLAHQQMYEIAAEAERASGSPAFLAWATNPWKPLGPLDRPLATETGTLSLALMPGERRAIALNVRSVSAVTSKVRIWVNVPGLRPDAIHIYQVNWTGNDVSNWAAAELELLGDASSTREASVLPGVTRQIWLEVHPDVVAVPGQFVGNVSLSTDEGQTTDVPLHIKVFATRFAAPSMHFGGWDYALSNGGYAVRETNRSQFVEYLQSRHVDTPWGQRDDRIVHWGNIDSSGNASAPLDSSAMARWLSQWPSARRYRVSVQAEDQIAGIPITDARFAGAVAAWAQALATEIRRLNKSPEQFDLCLVDEPQTDEQIRTAVAWARAIRESGAGFRIWTNVVWEDPVRMPESLFDVVDTIAVNMEFAERQYPWTHELWARTLAERGKTFEVYAFSGPARRLDPYTYYRLTAWRAFFMGASAVSFWSFAQTGGTPSDNEFATWNIDFSPLFVGEEIVRPGKHMEAAAEGLQDTYYFEMLKQVAFAHADEAVRLKAQELLHEAAFFVYESPPSAYAQWRSQSEVEGADRQRVRIAEFLDSLPR